MRYFTFILAFSLSFASNAEIYLGIGPLDKLGDVQEKFPRANITKLVAAWSQPHEALYEMKGPGLSGTVVLLFNDYRSSWKDLAEKSPDIELYETMYQQSDAEALVINWVRWIPDNLIPLQRLVSKYGRPEKSAFSDENYEPYRNWEKKGVTAYLSDDEKFVKRIDFSYTRDEQRKAFLQRKLPVPDWLKDTSETSKNDNKP